MLERDNNTTEQDIRSAKVLMISRFKEGSTGGIPSIVKSLEINLAEIVQTISTLRPDNQSSIDIHEDWDLVIFHHPSSFGIKKFIELPRKLKSRSSIIWYQAVDKETLKTFRKLGVGNLRIPPSISVNAEIITRKILTNYPGVLTYTISDNIRESLIKTGIATEKQISLVQVPPSISAEIEKPKDINQKDTEFTVLVVSRISPEKGIERVFNIYHQIFEYTNNNPQGAPKPIRFIIVGDATNKTYNESIKQLVSKSPTNTSCSIEIVGKKTDEEIAEYYKNANLFLMPSMFDSWGLVMIEAIHYGLPIISFNSPGAREIFNASNHEIGNIVDTIEAGTKLILDMMLDKSLQLKLSTGALRESKKYNPNKISIDLINKLWSDRYNKDE